MVGRIEESNQLTLLMEYVVVDALGLPVGAGE